MKPLNTMKVTEIRFRLQKLGDQRRAEFLQGFFKTGPGGYGEGDVFLGIRVPVLRRLVSEYKALALPEILSVLQSPIHEERLFGLLVLVRAYSERAEPVREKIYRMILANTAHINNWDLVDASAPHIVGGHLMNRSRNPLYQLAQAGSLWERRIAIIATLHFIRHHQYADTLLISELLLSDKEDLIHKAVGWMLREVGKRDFDAEERFLDHHWRRMPRTMLRYAIEKFPLTKRHQYARQRIG